MTFTANCKQQKLTVSVFSSVSCLCCLVGLELKESEKEDEIKENICRVCTFSVS